MLIFSWKLMSTMIFEFKENFGKLVQKIFEVKGKNNS